MYKKHHRSQIQPVKILAQVDVGYGNFLTIYGNWPESNWTVGYKMTNLSKNVWQFLVHTNSAIEFKVKFNDKFWETGPNQTTNPGNLAAYNPRFN